MRTDGRMGGQKYERKAKTDMTKQVIAFRNFANVPNRCGSRGDQNYKACRYKNYWIPVFTYYSTEQKPSLEADAYSCAENFSPLLKHTFLYSAHNIPLVVYSILHT